MFLESAEVKMKRSAYRLILLYYDDVLRMLFALDFFVFCVYKYKQYLSDDIIEEPSVYIVIMFLVFFTAAADDADGK